VACERVKKGALGQLADYSRFCSHAILQQLQIGDDFFCPEADIEMGDWITISSHPNNAMEIRWRERKPGKRWWHIADLRKRVIKILI
jgi:hypothetical protein